MQKAVRRNLSRRSEFVSVKNEESVSNTSYWWTVNVAAKKSGKTSHHGSVVKTDASLLRSGHKIQEEKHKGESLYPPRTSRGRSRLQVRQSLYPHYIQDGYESDETGLVPCGDFEAEFDAAQGGTVWKEGGGFYEHQFEHAQVIIPRSEGVVNVSQGNFSTNIHNSRHSFDDHGGQCFDKSDWKPPGNSMATEPDGIKEEIVQNLLESNRALNEFQSYWPRHFFPDILFNTPFMPSQLAQKMWSADWIISFDMKQFCYGQFSSLNPTRGQLGTGEVMGYFLSHGLQFTIGVAELSRIL